MAAISIGSVEVDVVPNASGILRRLQQAVVPAADSVGQEAGRIMGRHFSTQIAQAVRDGVTQGGRTAQAPATRQGQAAGGAFGRSFKARVTAALADLPDARIDADSSAADREIAAIRAQLLTLRDTTIGVDIDAGEASARIARLQERLTRLTTGQNDVNIRIDAGAANSQLAAFQAQISALDAQDVDVDVDTHTAAANFQLLTTAAIAFGPAILPVLPVVAAGLGSIAAAGAAAGAGLGALALVAVPAFKDIGGALQAQKAAQDAATSSTNSGAQAAVQASQRANQMASAQAAVASAERNGARQIAAAQKAVTQARQNAANVAAQAAQRSAQAARQVQDAERALADAQKDARQAQEDLTDARRTAALELEDLNNRLADSVLSQRDAEIQLQEATAERDVVLKKTNATELEKQKAVLAYDQAVQRLKEQTTETGRLKSETAAANKAGVDGSETVRNAQERVAAAQDQVRDRTRALKDAQADQARTAQQNAQDIAKAQQQIADAQAGVGQAQQQAAESAAAAQRQLAQAQQSTVGGTNAAADAQARYQAALAKMTPAARQTFNAFLNLRTAFSAWSRSLQPQVMPIFTRAINGLRKALPGLTPFVKGAADAIGVLQDKASAGFKSPWWKGFKKDLATSVKPAIIGLGVAFGNVFKGIAGVIGAFLPHMGEISSTLQRITKRFANWGQGLKGSPEFERFLSYSADKAPLIGDALGKVASAFLDVGVALAPVSGPLLQVIGGLAQGIGWLATNVPGLAIAIWGLMLATKLWAGAQILMNGAMKLFNLISLAGPWGWIVLAIAAVVAAVILMYNKFAWFRTAVQAVWSAIQIAAMWLWTNALKPAFDAIKVGLSAIGRAAQWLWSVVLQPVFSFISTAARFLATLIVTVLVLPFVLAFKALAAVARWLWGTVLQPVFTFIGGIVRWLWRTVVKPVFNLLVLQFKAFAKIARWLWTNVMSPVFQWIGSKARWLYANAIKPAIGQISTIFKAVAKVGKWLWSNVFKPVFNWIGDKAKWLWEKAVKPAFDKLKSGVGKVGDAFESARKFIKKAWDKLQGIAKKPVKFIIGTVYNKGIVPTWNKIATAFGADPIKEMNISGWATGGVLPGYTPGRDPHKFYSPSGMGLELSGGEAIMRPEFTRAVGAGFVNTMNAAARSRGSEGVKAALAPMLGGSAPMATDRTLKFADGGIFGWIGKGLNKAAGAGSAVWNKVKDAASWLKDGLEASARAGVKHVVEPLLAKFPGASGEFGKMIRRIPNKIIDKLFGYTKKADKKGGGGGVGGPRIAAALKWARTQNGKPYQWAGNGNPSWDCSGFMSAIESVIRGQKPHRRWATMAFAGKTAPPGWVYHGNSAFKVGITNAGVGHTAGTLGKTNVESRGGDGVVVGSRARGYKSSLFGSWYGFMPGKYDQGGMLQPGFNLAYNGTGKPEPVLTGRQFNALASNGGSTGPAHFEGNLYLDSGEFLGRVRGEATAVVQESQQQLVSTLRAG